jgi:hypothetical protein
MKQTLLLLLLALWLAHPAMAQADSLELAKKEKKKTGWTWAALPVVAYDADQGLQFGALGQVFDYGDGSTYPEYRHTIYGECSWFTKGSSVYQLFYDSRYLVPGGIRVTVDLDYLPEKALDFYGFNGYETNFDPAISTEGSDSYISRMYYRMERKMLRVLADFQGPVITQKFRWLAGINLIGMELGTVDIEQMNKGKAEEKKLPDTALLFDRYVEYGLIGSEEKEGGTTLFLKTGLVFDTRDNEAAPNKGIWSEILLLSAPTFFGNAPYAFGRVAVTHRQYVSLFPGKMVAACQLSYQGTVAGSAPYYILPYLFSSYSLSTKPDGLGGAKNLRGILRNRIVGDGVAFGNIELRWKFYRRVIFRQNIYFGLTGFFEGGMVVQERRLDMNSVPAEQRNNFFREEQDKLHMTTGLGVRIGLNENFIIAIDYGKTLNSQDGKSGLYIGVGNIF